MKKALWILVAGFGLASAVAAQDFRVSVVPSIGVSYWTNGGTVDLSSVQAGANYNAFGTMTQLNAGLGVDFTFLELRAAYMSQVGYGSSVQSISGFSGLLASANSYSETPVTTSYGMAFLDFRAVAKFPFKLGGGISLFPMAGVSYMYYLSSVPYVSDPTQQALANDLYFITGAGLDFALSNLGYLRVTLNWDINLTPLPSTVAAGVTYWGYRYQLAVAIGSFL